MLLSCSPDLRLTLGRRYPDMLEVAANNPVFNGAMLTHSEARAHFAAWCVLSSPLVLGFDLRNETAVAWAWDIIASERAIAVNQAYVGDTGTMVYSAGKVHMGAMGQHPAVMVLAKTIATSPKHKLAVLALNNWGGCAPLSTRPGSIPYSRARSNVALPPDGSRP